MSSLQKVMMVLVLGFAIGQLNAQEEKTLLKTEQLALKLELNEAQNAQLDEVLKQAEAQKRAQREKMRALREEMKRTAFLEQQAMKEKLSEFLTEEQLAELHQMRAQRSRRDRFREGRQERFRPELRERMRNMRSRMRRNHEAREKGGN